MSALTGLQALHEKYKVCVSSLSFRAAGAHQVHSTGEGFGDFRLPMQSGAFSIYGTRW